MNTKETAQWFEQATREMESPEEFMERTGFDRDALVRMADKSAEGVSPRVGALTALQFGFAFGEAYAKEQRDA